MLPARIQSCTPWRDGISPVRSDARAGEHTGETQKKSVKRTPFTAMRSRVGVTMSALPAQRIAHGPWSSLRTNSTFGRCASRLAIDRFLAHDDAAVDVERGTGGEIAIVGGDEQRHARDLFDGAE